MFSKGSTAMDISTGLEDLKSLGIKRYPSSINASYTLRNSREIGFLMLMFEIPDRLLLTFITRPGLVNLSRLRWSKLLVFPDWVKKLFTGN